MNSSRMRVKMCGMTRRDDVEHAVNLGVDAIGLIFYAKSLRNVSIADARQLLADLPPFINTVAVLVNPERDFVTELINELPLTLLQFHGDETAEFCQQFTRPYIKAVHAKSSAQLQRLAEEHLQAQALLMDTFSETQRGGTGLTFDWQIIPDQFAKPYILAGGLNEQNIATALTSCKPYAVDVCSGVESMPGVKDHQKMNQFIKALWDIK